MAPRHPQRNQTSEEAAAWMLRLSVDRSLECRVQFDQWIRQSCEHVGEFLNAQRMWSELDEVRGLEGIETEVPGNDSIVDFPIAKADAAPSAGATTATPDSRKRKWLSTRRIAVVAIFLIAMVVGALYYGTYANRILSTASDDTYMTEVGAMREVSLADGSVLTLNTDSEVRVRFDANRREVFLARGEARFLVAADKARPFIVTANDTTVRAVGTLFVVRVRNADEMTVAVAEGRVAVDNEVIRERLERLFLDANHLATIRPDAIVQVKLSDKSMAALLSWQKGILSFGGLSLQDAVDEINRYNRVKLVIDDSRIAGLKLGGAILNKDSALFANVVEASLPVNADRRKNKDGEDEIFLTAR